MQARGVAKDAETASSSALQTTSVLSAPGSVGTSTLASIIGGGGSSAQSSRKRTSEEQYYRERLIRALDDSRESSSVAANSIATVDATDDADALSPPLFTCDDSTFIRRRVNQASLSPVASRPPSTHMLAVHGQGGSSVGDGVKPASPTSTEATEPEVISIVTAAEDDGLGASTATPVLMRALRSSAYSSSPPCAQGSPEWDALSVPSIGPPSIIEVDDSERSLQRIREQASAIAHASDGIAVLLARARLSAQHAEQVSSALTAIQALADHVQAQTRAHASTLHGASVTSQAAFAAAEAAQDHARQSVQAFLRASSPSAASGGVHGNENSAM